MGPGRQVVGHDQPPDLESLLEIFGDVALEEEVVARQYPASHYLIEAPGSGVSKHVLCSRAIAAKSVLEAVISGHV